LTEHGGKPVAQLEPRHLLQILEAQSSTPAQANALRNVLRLMLQHGFERGWRKDNPARDVKRLRYVKKPYPAWTEGDIAAFEARWPRGSRARLALALLLYTGQRRGDVIRMGPQHVRGGVIVWRQQKTGAELELPMHPELRAELAAAPTGHPAFLVTEQGRPFASGTGFYNWVQGLRGEGRRRPDAVAAWPAQSDGAPAGGGRLHAAPDRGGHRTPESQGGGAVHSGGGSAASRPSAVVRLGRPPENEA
jgi:integrase